MHKHFIQLLCANDQMMEELSRKECTFAYTDACPSELLHNSYEEYLCIGLINFLYIDKGALNKFNQFKKTRGIKRRLNVQKYMIEAIQKGQIVLGGVINWNYRDEALRNGEKILAECGIPSSKREYDEIIQIGNETLSYGHAVSLGWYSFVLALFLKQLGVFAKVEQKNTAMILIDLLPGDNEHWRRNLDVVRFISNYTELKEFQRDSLRKNSLSKIGYGYGIKDGSTKNLKNDFEYTIVDWIVQSFHSFVLYKMKNLESGSKEYQLSELARYLLNSEVFKMPRPIVLKD